MKTNTTKPATTTKPTTPTPAPATTTQAKLYQSWREHAPRESFEDQAARETEFAEWFGN